IHKDGDGDALFQLESDSLPHAHAQPTKTYYKHQDSRIMKAQELKTNKDKDLKILEKKTKLKDNDKGSRSNITKHEGTSIQQDKDQKKDSRTKRRSNLNKSKEVRFKDLASGEIVSLKILSQTRKLGHYLLVVVIG
ncbi:hypothetical protein Tco_0027683, partial [Tanacetum coccineum]